VLPRAGSATVIDDAELRHGMVDALSGFVRYKVTYNALMFRPFRHEVLDAVVKSVSEVGFFAEAGPLSILVSHAHIPEDMAYAPADGSYTSGESGVKIRADMPVRVKIIGATVLQSALCAIGSIKEPYLGLLA
jgi:DNA-directed RNA polymerase II subunit RPB7